MSNPPLSSDTKAFYEQVHTWRVKYPHWCMTTSRAPDHNVIKNPGQFGRWHRIVFRDTAYWAFQDLEMRDKFIKTHAALHWSP